jgi:Ca-activated chloride channel family protein
MNRAMDTRLTTPVLRTRPEKAAVSRDGCRLDVLVQLETPPLPATAEERRPVAIALVIDRSGSMAGGKLKAACAAAQQLVRQLTPADRVAVISFDHSARTEVPLTTPDASVIERIGRIRSGGQTALFDGWCEGLAALQGLPEAAGYQKRVLLLTDGQANVGPHRCSEVAPWVGQARELAISTSCIGLGEDYEERLLTAMAEAGDGNLVHLTSPGQLEAVFAAELEGMNLCLGRELELRFITDGGSALRRIHNPLEPDGAGWIRLGTLQAGATPTLALRLQVEPCLDSAVQLSDLLRVEARWRDRDGERQHLEAVLRLPLVDGSSWPELPVDEEVRRQVLLQQAARQRQEAMASIDRGDVQATTASVQLALSSLEQVKGSGEVQQEQQLLGELLELISSEKLAIARKVMGTQAYMRARGRKVRDQEGRSDG